MSSSQIHARAVEVARKYRACEVELIEVLQEVERHRVYLHHGCNSLFKYACDCLGLSEDVAYIFINVARKVTQVPELAKEIREGRLTIAKAKRIAPILNSTNKTEVLTFAANASKREIERRVAQEAPTFAIHDKLSFTADPVDKVTLKRNVEHRREARVQLQVGVSEELMVALRHAQDLISQKKQRTVGLEDVLSILVESYVRKEDPVEKAKRFKIKGQVGVTHTQVIKNLGMDSSAEVQLKKEEKTATSSQETATQPLKQLGPGLVRRAFAAKTKHEVFLKFGGRCSYENGDRRCNQKRFLHIHHKVPVSRGGTNEVSNLELLCSGHHKARHLELSDHH
jgi:HNH endonuclease